MERLIASTDPWDYGYKWYDNLKGYFYSESDIDPSDITVIAYGYNGNPTQLELPDGTQVERWELQDYGIYEEYGSDSFDTDIGNIRKQFDSAPYGYVASGYAGLWDGRHRGGKFIADIGELLDTLSGYDDVKITDEDGEIVLYMYHHDGTNVLTLREVTAQGNKFRYDKEDELYPEEIIETVFHKSGYSVKPNIANKVYGEMSANRKASAKRETVAKKKVASKSFKPKATAKKPVKKTARKPAVKKTRRC